MKKLKLVLPSKKYASAYLKALNAFAKEKNNVAKGPDRVRILHSVKDFPQFMKVFNEERKGISIPNNRVPATLYLAVVGNKVVGRVHIRHRLNKGLKIVGGHIGYSVVPSERRKGYATQMLHLALQKTKKMGIKKALVTCDETNIASKKVIEKNGGVFYKKVKNPDKPVMTLQYWL